MFCIGENNDAKNYVMKILEIDPNNTSAHKLLSTLINYKKNEKHLEKMRKLTEDKIFKQFSKIQKTELLFALSKAYEDIKDFENSFNYFKQANLIQNKTNSGEIENIKKLFDNLIKLFDSIEIKQTEVIEKTRIYLFVECPDQVQLWLNK